LKLQAIRPHKKDLKFALGDLEAFVLRRLWESDKPIATKELQAKIVHARPVAVTTVATILDRLYRKGIVSRQLVREGGPHYLYSAKLSESEFRQAVVDNVMGTLLHSFSDVTVAYLAEKMAPTSADEQRILSKYLNRLRARANK
jgi:predicted transcriptional regulator